MRTKDALLAVMLLGAAVAAGGCEKALFPEGTPRSPYDRYAILRGQERQQTQKNIYGGDEPALRERLRPMDEP